VFGASLATKILEIFKINYVHIFEINFYKQVTPIQFLVVSLAMLSFLGICLISQLLELQFYWVYEAKYKLPTLILVLIFFLSCFGCFGGRDVTHEIFLVIRDIIISPFSVVNFRRFFLADIFCSSKLMFTDLIGSYCFFSQKEY